MAALATRKPIPVSKYANVPAFQPAPRPVPLVKAEELRQARKCDQAARVLDKLEARSASLAAEIKALQKRKAAIDARYTRIEDRVIAELQGAGYDRFHGIRAEFQLRNAPLALQVENESAIPPHFFREKIVTSVDKIAVKAAIEAGEDVPGCSLTQKVSLIRK
ncbi:MAG TPA: siphovirus Gp157 family protein [Bryobacteraceae bacterium]|nr:siphovirus Gp157 family protein [Bryobacteraceae bacterium]